jgi:hypothetical protein
MSLSIGSGISFGNLNITILPYDYIPLAPLTVDYLVVAGGGGGGGTIAGGGGGGGSISPYYGGNGGTGVVILSYASASQLGSGGSVTSYTSGVKYQVHTFTSSGTYTA